MASLPDPYSRTTHDGRPIDHATAARLRMAEERLGYELTVTQGIGGAAASAGTHVEGRAVDLAPWDWQNKLRVLKDLGFVAWYRPYVAGLWPAHIHAVLIFDGRDNHRGIAESAWRQIGSFDQGRDGLANNNVDTLHPYRPDPRRGFSMEDYRKSFRVKRERLPRIDVVTFNPWVGNRDLRGNLRQLIEDTSRPLALSLQEMKGERLTPKGYTRIQADPKFHSHPEDRSTVLLVRNKGVEILETGVLDTADFGSKGWTWGPKGQPKTSVEHPPKIFPWARLATPDFELCVLAGHRVAGGDNINEDEWAAEHKAITRWFENRPNVACLAAMDWNGRDDDMSKFGVGRLVKQLGAESAIRGIDGVIATNVQRLRSEKHDEKYGSDGHRPVLTTAVKER
jgi:hypothetical protein